MITIIVPVYNAKEHLNHCVNSLVQQSYPEIEIILIDDGSTDGSDSLCDEWGDQDQRIQVIHKPNEGVSSARNTGIKMAKGEYLLFIDSDDALASDTCKILVELQEKEKSDCIVFGIKQTNGNIWAPRQHAKYYSSTDFKTDFTYWLNAELISPPVNKFFKKELIYDLFQKSMSFGEDLVFCLSYLKHCERIIFIPDALYLHNNLNVNSITHQFDKKRIYDIEAWETSVLSFFSNNGQDPGLYQKYIKDVLFYIKGWCMQSSVQHKAKREWLTQWYRQSYLRKTDFQFDGPIRDKILLFLIKRELWSLIQILISYKTKFKSQQCFHYNKRVSSSLSR